MNKIENYLGVANHDIQMANNSQELKSYVASILCENDELQQENEKNKHYKTLYQSLKKQKDDGIDWIKNNFCYVDKKMTLKPFSDLKDLLEILKDSDVDE